MYKFTRIIRFARSLFDDEKTSRKASKIMEGILEAQSPRLSDIADKMRGNEAGNYKMIQRFLKQEDVMERLNRLFNEEAEFVISDPPQYRFEVTKVVFFLRLIYFIQAGQTFGLSLFSSDRYVRPASYY